MRLVVCNGVLGHGDRHLVTDNHCLSINFGYAGYVNTTTVNIDGFRNGDCDYNLRRIDMRIISEASGNDLNNRRSAV